MHRIVVTNFTDSVLYVSIAKTTTKGTLLLLVRPLPD